jgi:hypothetical protein
MAVYGCGYRTNWLTRRLFAMNACHWLPNYLRILIGTREVSVNPDPTHLPTLLNLLLTNH